MGPNNPHILLSLGFYTIELLVDIITKRGYRGGFFCCIRKQK